VDVVLVTGCSGSVVRPLSQYGCARSALDPPRPISNRAVKQRSAAGTGASALGDKVRAPITNARAPSESDGAFGLTFVLQSPTIQAAQDDSRTTLCVF
jgi:hypothetical protein